MYYFCTNVYCKGFLFFKQQVKKKETSSAFVCTHTCILGYTVWMTFRPLSGRKELNLPLWIVCVCVCMVVEVVGGSSAASRSKSYLSAYCSSNMPTSWTFSIPSFSSMSSSWPLLFSPSFLCPFLVISAGSSRSFHCSELMPFEWCILLVTDIWGCSLWVLLISRYQGAGSSDDIFEYFVNY